MKFIAVIIVERTGVYSDTVIVNAKNHNSARDKMNKYIAVLSEIRDTQYKYILVDVEHGEITNGCLTRSLFQITHLDNIIPNLKRNYLKGAFIRFTKILKKEAKLIGEKMDYLSIDGFINTYVIPFISEQFDIEIKENNSSYVVFAISFYAIIANQPGEYGNFKKVVMKPVDFKYPSSLFFGEDIEEVRKFIVDTILTYCENCKYHMIEMEKMHIGNGLVSEVPTGKDKCLKFDNEYLNSDNKFNIIPCEKCKGAYYREKGRDL